jgi:hypothetical protein
MSELHQKFTSLCSRLGDITYKIHRAEKALQDQLVEQQGRAATRDQLLEQIREIEIEYIAEQRAAAAKKTTSVEKKEVADVNAQGTV